MKTNVMTICAVVAIVAMGLAVSSISAVVVDSFDNGIDSYLDVWGSDPVDYQSSEILPIPASNNTRAQNNGIWNPVAQGEATNTDISYNAGKVSFVMNMAQGHNPDNGTYAGSNIVSFAYNRDYASQTIVDLSGFSGIDIDGTTQAAAGNLDGLQLRIWISNAANPSRWAEKTIMYSAGAFDNLAIDFADFNYWEEDMMMFDTTQIAPYTLDQVGFISVEFLLNNNDTLNTSSSFAYQMDQITLVPEPATIALLTLGSIAAIRRRRHA